MAADSPAAGCRGRGGCATRTIVLWSERGKRSEPAPEAAVTTLRRLPYESDYQEPANVRKAPRMPTLQPVELQGVL